MAVTELELAEAERRMRTRRAAAPLAIAARYDPPSGRVVVMLNTQVELRFPAALAEGLADADPDALSEVQITPGGLGLHFPRLDADLYVPALLEGMLGSRKWMARALGKAGGAQTSEAKAQAARANGKLGGRPRKSTVT